MTNTDGNRNLRGAREYPLVYDEALIPADIQTRAWEMMDAVNRAIPKPDESRRKFDFGKKRGRWR